jgi:hypothetical protein
MKLFIDGILISCQDLKVRGPEPKSGPARAVNGRFRKNPLKGLVLSIAKSTTLIGF